MPVPDGLPAAALIFYLHGFASSPQSTVYDWPPLAETAGCSDASNRPTGITAWSLLTVNRPPSARSMR